MTSGEFRQEVRGQAEQIKDEDVKLSIGQQSQRSEVICTPVCEGADEGKISGW